MTDGPPPNPLDPEPSMAVIEAGRLTLVKWSRHDAPALMAAVEKNTEHLAPWMPWIALGPASYDERIEIMDRWDREWSAGLGFYFGLWIGEDLVGSAGIHNRLRPGALEIGYWVDADYTNQGLATAATGALTTAAFSFELIDEVEIHHDRANVASRRVPEKLGYQLVREYPRPVEAPGECGITMVWMVTRSLWARG